MTTHQRAIAAVIVSTRSAAGHREDLVTPHIAELADQLGYRCRPTQVIPDGQAVGTELSRMLAESPPEVILTSGGTGVTPDDLTPEHTSPLLDKHLPGVMEALRAHGRTVTPLAGLSRGVAGVAGSTVIINLPGFPGAVAQGAEVLSELLPHLCDQVADIRAPDSWGGHHHA